MQYDQGIDSSLQRSIDELDQEFQDQDSEQLSSEGEEDDVESKSDDQKSSKNQQDNIKHHKKQKKSAYDQLLPPDQDVDSVPPFVVVVHGSKSSGKSSLIRSLVKHFTKQKIDEIKGTITLRSTKKQRITIIQCPNDIRAMIDLSKIADIVLLIFDASLGFEMQTFQFLSLLKCHGFPHIMGVLNHLDYYKDNKQQRKTKKKFKKRFQYEVSGNNKLFFLSKYDNGVYSKIQTAKIARYIGTSNPPSILWRQNHPYIVADRWQPAQDRNYQKNDEIDCQFYGYIRGSSYRMNGKVHFVGMGDYFVKQVEVISDPCPQYRKNQQPQKQENENKIDEESENDSQQSQEHKKVKQQKIVTQITAKKKKRRTLNTNQRIIYAPNCNLGTLNFEHTSGFVTIPHQYVKFTRRQKGQDSSEESEVEQGVQMVRDLQNMKETLNQKLKNNSNNFQLFQGMEMQDSDSDIKNANQAQLDFARKKKEINQMKQKTENLLIANPDEAQNNNRRQDLDYLIYESKQKMRTYDCSKFHPVPTPIDPIQFKNLFMTGMQGDILNEMQEDSEQKDKKQSDIKKLLQKNTKKVTINQRNNFFQKGYYVKITIQKLKYEDYLRINHKMPIIISRINLGEDNLGFIKVNFKRHRWYSNLLKSNDPIIVSSGWRRYQTMIVFAKQDPNDRMRYLKYTPGHDFCTGVFYGNFNQQNNGCIFTQTIKEDLKKFRIAGSGLIMQINKSFQIMKKIKLIGEPYKIMKNTAFVKGMFNSNIEVANYIGAQIRTVSGIRGQIKKALKQGGEGTFRATFEDKILMSDIIFCRAWYRIILERFYNPILNFGKNRLMKTKYELRIQKGVEAEHKPDSEYKNVDRAPQVFAPFVVPKKLQSNLPFKTRQKVKISKKQKIEKKQNASMPKLLMSDKQRQVASLIQRLNTIRNEKSAKKQEKLKEKQRIKSAMQRPKQQYYEQLKKQQKSEKMAALMRKKRSNDRKVKDRD